ncbi:MAG TPA: c-type cytochrome [Burkholderiales bacterium]|nr:c-type cytochrome [Burkholderiales bacterium]
MRSKVALYSAMLIFTVYCATSRVIAADSNYARNLAAGCANCHGTDGRSVGVVPPLAGLDKNYIILQMQDFKHGRRPSSIMQQIAQGYSDQQIELMAQYFAVRK